MMESKDCSVLDTPLSRSMTVFARSEAKTHPIVPCMTRHAPLLLLTSEIIGILPAKSETPSQAPRKRSGQGYTMNTWRIGVIMAAWLALVAAPGAGSAQQSYPNRPVRIVIPYSPGSVADVFARIIAQNMAVQWNASIIVESKSGANGRSRPRKSRARRPTATRGFW